MNLLFFDIECAGVHKTYAKICAFGYVLCDNKFNIIEKRDVLINPKGRFELTDRKGVRGLVLPYKYEDFKKYPLFTAEYEKIKSLLEDPENIVIGHAVLNDVKYLNLETDRFSLKPFNYKFWDSQLVYMTYTNDFSHQFGLEHIAEELNVEFVPHRAADDAYATMKIVEEICRRENCDFLTLAKKLKLTVGKTAANVVTPPTSEAFTAYRLAALAVKAERSQKRQEFYNKLVRQNYLKNGKLHGKVFIFSRVIEDNLELSLPLLERIYKLGGRYTQKVDSCNVCVADSDDFSPRANNAREAKKQIMDLKTLGELLND